MNPNRKLLSNLHWPGVQPPNWNHQFGAADRKKHWRALALRSVYPPCTSVGRIGCFWRFSRLIESITYAFSASLLVRSPPPLPKVLLSPLPLPPENLRLGPTRPRFWPQVGPKFLHKSVGGSHASIQNSPTRITRGEGMVPSKACRLSGRESPDDQLH
jgi:hypothetical protein